MAAEDCDGPQLGGYLEHQRGEDLNLHFPTELNIPVHEYQLLGLILHKS